MSPFSPYYAVIFTSLKKEKTEGYERMAEKMGELAKQQVGFIEMESARQEIGITISYWDSLDAIKRWKQNAEHLLAQELGRTQWYEHYKVRICLVEREYEY